MKRIEETIQALEFGRVKETLMNQGVEEITVAEVKCFGREAYAELYHGAQYSIDFLPKVQIQILAFDEKVSQIVDTLMESACAGKRGDGKILGSQVDVVHAI